MHIIAVASRKGGVGKSTIAMHLAMGLTFDKSRVLVVDTDPQGTVTTWNMAALANETPFPFRVLNFWESESKNPMGLGSFVKRESANADYIIIDCPAGADDLTTQQALVVANLALIPVQPSAADYWATRGTVKVAELATTLNKGLKTYLVVNLVMSQSTIQASFQEQFANIGAPVLKTRIKRRNQYQEAVALGKTVFSPGLRGEARNEMTAFVAEVKRKLRGNPHD